MCLERLADRFAEHPQLVCVITNLTYREAPSLEPRNPELIPELQWWDVPLNGTSGHELSKEIEKLDPILQQGWQTVSSPNTGNPLYAKPSVLVLYREDHRFALDDVIPTKTRYTHGYDLILAAQPYRSRGPAEFKVDKILAPLAENLRDEGRMIVIQSTGHDPGMEIIRSLWPDEQPFATPRHTLVKRLDHLLNLEGQRFRFEGDGDEASLFTYHLHALPDEVGGSRIGTSTLLARMERRRLRGPDRRRTPRPLPAIGRLRRGDHRHPPTSRRALVPGRVVRRRALGDGLAARAPTL